MAGGRAGCTRREQSEDSARVTSFESSPNNPGMHTTDTVDFDAILSGEVYLELDDGAEVLLKAGDCAVQNGTRHVWHNRSSQNCVIAVTLVGAERTR